MKTRAFVFGSNGISEVKETVPEEAKRASEYMKKIFEALPQEMSNAEISNLIFNIFRVYGCLKKAEEILMPTMLGIKAFSELVGDDENPEDVPDASKFN